MSEALAVIDLSGEIRSEYEQAETLGRDAVAHAIRCGELLQQQKDALGHGEWLPWVEANFVGSIKTASNYIRLAQNQGQGLDLPSVSQGLKAIAAKDAEVKPRKPKPVVDAVVVDEFPQFEETGKPVADLGDDDPFAEDAPVEIPEVTEDEDEVDPFAAAESDFYAAVEKLRDIDPARTLEIVGEFWAELDEQLNPATVE